ncbi:MAG: hypothetical protein H7A51_02945 [Akkermansiaceae bacterium]|nr:hypothetical protein [Akkermansiaceae bacterium]
MNPSIPSHPISIHRYALRSKTSLNAGSTRCEHHGALIRVDGGYACIHPWPELGDEDLDRTLALLASGKPTPLARRAWYCAQMDGAARRDAISLFDGLVVPESHATLTTDDAAVRSAVEAGFEIAKLKVGRHLAQEAAFIREYAGQFPHLAWRLDFNGTQSPESVAVFLGTLGDEVRQKIDFIEDAYLPNTSPWVDALAAYDIPVAVDREVEDVCGGYGIAVIKPARNIPEPLLARAAEEGKRVVFTSYMDHPLGQSFAAWEAAVARKSHGSLVSTCGLVTHGLFEPDAFTEALGKPEPSFHPAAGTGLGFDELLAALPWTPLK